MKNDSVRRLLIIKNKEKVIVCVRKFFDQQYALIYDKKCLIFVQKIILQS